MILSIDPGVNTCGLAIWSDTKILRKALLVSNSKGTWWGMADAVAGALLDIPAEGLRGVIELPQVYRKGPGDPGDLIQLAAVVGAVTATVRADWTTVLPREWKGQTPKDVMVARVIKKLSVEEVRCVQMPQRASLAHNVWDAVGIGLWGLKRLR